MSLVESVATILAEATCDKPMFLHIDAIGLLHFGENIGNDLEEIIKNKLVSFSKALVLAESYGANVIIPSFSYSLAERDIYNVSNSQSKVGAATEFLRKINTNRRTLDPVFSYILFSNNEELRNDLEVKDYNTFGENSLIDKVYKMGGYFAGIGGVLFRMTEAHYLEKKLNVTYRFDKQFDIKVEHEGQVKVVRSTFFCRDLSLGKQANFKPLLQELRKLDLIEELYIDSSVIEMVEMRKVFPVMKDNLNKNPFFFLKDMEQ